VELRSLKVINGHVKRRADRFSAALTANPNFAKIGLFSGVFRAELPEP
jgi:hypothetical protein